MYILIVEDQQRLAAALKAICEEDGYRVDLAFDGQEGLDYASLAEYDALVLDIMLPKLNGFEVIAELRKRQNNVPVIMLTARSAMGDKIRGLDLGADDYLTKPFNPAELLARLRALTRRQGTVILDTIRLGNTVLNLETADISVETSAEAGQDEEYDEGEGDRLEEGRQGAPEGEKAASSARDTEAAAVHLSQRERDVLKLFLGVPGKTFSKTDILQRVWGPESDAEENSVEVYVSFLRKKLAHIGSNLSILTIRSLGYRIEVGDA
ncbi:MAG: response regulator transcription factor [Coriobacteriales bacterium]|jgi:DNA-binding response OmpR family regulator|nr:response regulator transcription factor [Coriobacteriales bacterium]